MMWFIEEGDVEIGGGFLDIEFIFEMEVVLLYLISFFRNLVRNLIILLVMFIVL